MNVLNKFFKSMINLVMQDGLSLKWLVTHIGVDAINLIDAQVSFEDKFVLITSKVTK